MRQSRMVLMYMPEKLLGMFLRLRPAPIFTYSIVPTSAVLRGPFPVDYAQQRFAEQYHPMCVICDAAGFRHLAIFGDGARFYGWYS